jgi:hypothetical protein
LSQLHFPPAGLGCTPLDDWYLGDHITSTIAVGSRALAVPAGTPAPPPACHRRGARGQRGYLARR